MGRDNSDSYFFCNWGGMGRDNSDSYLWQLRGHGQRQLWQLFVVTEGTWVETTLTATYHTYHSHNKSNFHDNPWLSAIVTNMWDRRFVRFQITCLLVCLFHETCNDEVQAWDIVPLYTIAMNDSLTQYLTGVTSWWMQPSYQVPVGMCVEYHTSQDTVNVVKAWLCSSRPLNYIYCMY